MSQQKKEEEEQALMLRYQIQVVLWKGKLVGTIFNNLNEKNFANKTIKVLDNKPDMKKKVFLVKKNLTKFDYQSGKKRFCKLMENL